MSYSLSKKSSLMAGLPSMVKNSEGSIESGATRGQACVSIVSHKQGSTQAHRFYEGDKESEIPCLRSLIEDKIAKGSCLSADALHLNPETTKLINKQEGVYLMSLKGNQEKLTEEMFWAQAKKPEGVYETVEKGHGRIETRRYEVYNIRDTYQDERWAESGLSLLVKVERQRYDCLKKSSSNEVSYYLSNGLLKGKSKLASSKETHRVHSLEDYCQAVRQHWSIEVTHHYRDVTLSEDSLRSKKRGLQKVCASLRTFVLNSLLKAKQEAGKKRVNIKAKLELFQDSFNVLLLHLKNYAFL